MQTHRRGIRNFRAITSTFAILVCCAGGLLLRTPSKSQTASTPQSLPQPQWEIDAGGKMSFEVASVKLNTDGHPAPPAFQVDNTDRYDSSDRTRFSSTHTNIPWYIAFAYKLRSYE